MTINQFLVIIKARLWLIAGLFLLVVFSAISVTLMLPKTYTATAAVVLDVKSPDPIAGMVLPALFQPSYMATQLDLIQSERVVRGVIKQLNLAQNPQVIEAWMAQTKGVPGSFEPWLTDLLLKNFSASPSKESNVLRISYSGTDPNFSAALANAFVDSYINTTLELRVEPAKRFNVMFDEQTRQARERLEEAQRKLSDYQRVNGLIATDERMDIENTRLAELSSQLVAIQALRGETSSRVSQADGNLANTPEAIGNSVVASLITERSRLEARLKEQQANFGDAHPNVLQTKATISELRARIDEETKKVGASLGVNFRVNMAREAQIKSALEEQRNKVLSMKDQRDKARVLMKDVESAQLAYDQVLSRRNLASLESQNTQTNVSVVKRATAPYQPSGPSLLINTALAIAIGFIFAVTVAVLLELWDRRLRADEDVDILLGLPALGSVLDARNINNSAKAGYMQTAVSESNKLGSLAKAKQLLLGQPSPTSKNKA